MKKIILLSLALTCCWVGVNGQTVTGKMLRLKTQKSESVRRRAVKSAGLDTQRPVFTGGRRGRFGFHFRAKSELIRRQANWLKVGRQVRLEQVFKNLSAALEAAGSSTEHILKATVFLADMADYNTMNELYRKQFKGDPPARTTVQVARLPRDARIEIEAMAIVKN